MIGAQKVFAPGATGGKAETAEAKKHPARFARRLKEQREAGLAKRLGKRYPWAWRPDEDW